MGALILINFSILKELGIIVLYFFNETYQFIMIIGEYYQTTFLMLLSTSIEATRALN